MRILRDYFNYDVQFVMNITDIDDKIIKRYSLFLVAYIDRMNEIFLLQNWLANMRRSFSKI